MNYFEYIKLENIIGHKRAATESLKNINILYGLKGAKLNIISVPGTRFTPHWSQTVSPFASTVLTPMPLMPIHRDDEQEPTNSNWAANRLASLAFLSADADTQQGMLLSSSSNTSKPLSKNTLERMVRAMNYLMQQAGMSSTAAAGVVGVFMAESGLEPGKYNESEKNRFGGNGGRGLGQWSNVGNSPSGWRRTAYEKFLNGRTPTLELDLDFFLEEVKSRPKVLAVLNNPNSTIEDVVDAMHRGYENGSSQAFASQQQMGYTYTTAWKNDPTITRPYVFNDEAQRRVRFALQAQEAYNNLN